MVLLADGVVAPRIHADDRIRKLAQEEQRNACNKEKLKLMIYFIIAQLFLHGCRIKSKFSEEDRLQMKKLVAIFSEDNKEILYKICWATKKYFTRGPEKEEMGNAIAIFIGKCCNDKYIAWSSPIV